MVNSKWWMEAAFIRSPFTIRPSLLLRLLVARLAPEAEFGRRVGGERVGLLFGREGARAHVVGVSLDGLAHRLAHVGVLADEARAGLAEREAEQVVRAENLRVAVGARLDADRRDVQRR